MFKAYKKITALDDYGFCELEIEVDAGIDDAGLYEIKPEQIMVEHL